MVAEIREHGEPGRVKLLGRGGGAAAGHAVRLLHQGDRKAVGLRSCARGLEIRRADAATGAVSEHERAHGLLLGVDLGPRRAMRCLDCPDQAAVSSRSARSQFAVSSDAPSSR